MLGAVEAARGRIMEKRKEYEKTVGPKVKARKAELKALLDKRLQPFSKEVLKADSAKKQTLAQTQPKDLNKIRDIQNAFRNAEAYEEEVYALGSAPFIQVAAVFCGEMTRFDQFDDLSASRGRKRKPAYAQGKLDI